MTELAETLVGSRRGSISTGVNSDSPCPIFSIFIAEL